jgi:maltose O-acetyltransferase
VRTGLRCEYGTQVVLGAGAFLDHDCHLLDATPIRIGAGARIGARCSCSRRPIPSTPYARRDGWRKGKPVTIGDNVLLGAGVIVCPGVTIGHDTVVGAGAVVTRDLPPRWSRPATRPARAAISTPSTS